MPIYINDLMIFFLDYDPAVVEQKEASQPACIPLSYVLKFFTEASRRENQSTAPAPDVRRRLLSAPKTPSVRSSTPTGLCTQFICFWWRPSYINSYENVKLCHSSVPFPSLGNYAWGCLPSFMVYVTELVMGLREPKIDNWKLCRVLNPVLHYINILAALQSG